MFWCLCCMDMFIIKSWEQSIFYQEQKVWYLMLNLFVFWYLFFMSMYVMQTIFFVHKFTISEYTRFFLCFYYLKSEAIKSFFHFINNSGYCLWHIITSHSHLSLGNEFFFLYKLLYGFQENWFPMLYFYVSNSTSCQ